MTIFIDTTTAEKPSATNTIDPTAQSTFKDVSIIQANIANVAGSGAGAALTIAVEFTSLPGFASTLPPSANYAVFAHANQPVNCSWNTKTTTGFNLVLTPLSSGYTVAVGLFDLKIEWQA